MNIFLLVLFFSAIVFAISIFVLDISKIKRDGNVHGKQSRLYILDDVSLHASSPFASDFTQLNNLHSDSFSSDIVNNPAFANQPSNIYHHHD